MLRCLCLLLLLATLHPATALCQSARGQLKEGRPVGVWEYYDGQELGLRFDYDSSRIQYSRPDTTRYLVQLDSTWRPRQLYRAPRVLGSRTDLLLAMQRQLRYPLADLRAGTTGTVVLTYVLDVQGRKTNPVATVVPSKTLAEEVYRVVESIPVTYLPAVYLGRRIPAKITFVVRFCICKVPDECEQCLKAQAAAVPKPLGSQGEVIVTGALAR